MALARVPTRMPMAESIIASIASMPSTPKERMPRARRVAISWRRSSAFIDTVATRVAPMTTNTMAATQIKAKSAVLRPCQ